MERLTYRGSETMTEDGLIIPSYSDYSPRRIIERLAEYEDLEEQGLLLRLPCKVGDTVYRIENGKITQTKITKYDIYADGSTWFSFSTSLSLPMSKFKTCIFLTKEEAEQKLKEMESD